METITAYDFKTKATEAFAGATKRYIDDLNAMGEDQLTTCPGGCARTPADFTHEVTFINRRIAKRLNGQDPGPFEFKGWMTAPDEMRTKAAAVKEFQESAKEIEDALANIPEEEMLRKIETPSGETSPYDLVTFCAMHIIYHDAQLNYIQSLGGDAEMHWG